MRLNNESLTCHLGAISAGFAMALPPRFLDFRRRGRTQMFMNDFQSATAVALKNLGGTAEERVADYPAAVFVFLAGMKPVCVRSNRKIGPDNLDFDGIEFNTGI